MDRDCGEHPRSQAQIALKTALKMQKNCQFSKVCGRGDATGKNLPIFKLQGLESLSLLEFVSETTLAEPCCSTFLHNLSLNCS